MLFIQKHFDIRHDGNVTVVRAQSGPANGNPTTGHRPSTGPRKSRHQLDAQANQRRLILFGMLIALGVLALACIAILIAVPFGVFPGSLFDQVKTVGIALLGLLLALGPGGLILTAVLRGPVEELRIDRATGRVDVVEMDLLSRKRRVKTAPIETVRVKVVTMGDRELVFVGTRSLMGFQLQIMPVSANGSAEELGRELSAALIREPSVATT